MNDPVIAELKLTLANGEEQTHTLRHGQSIKIGRVSTNDIVLEQGSVSREHATLSASRSGVVLADLDSTNGTFLNGEQLTSMRDLQSHDLIDIGETKIRIELSVAEIGDNRVPGKRSKTALLRPLSLTVMVTSVQNYYSMVEQLPTNDVVQMLLRWSDSLRSVVEGLEGAVDKIIDSSVVVVWSGQQATPLACKAVQAALAADVELQKLLDSWPHQNEFPWNVSFSISSGHGLGGELGVSTGEESGAFTILGDPINFAFGLEKAAQGILKNAISEQPGILKHICLCEETARLVGDAQSVRTLGTVELCHPRQKAELYTVA